MMCVHYSNAAQKGFCNKMKLLKLVYWSVIFFYPGIIFHLCEVCCVFFAIWWRETGLGSVSTWTKTYGLVCSRAPRRRMGRLEHSPLRRRRRWVWPRPLVRRRRWRRQWQLGIRLCQTLHWFHSQAPGKEIYIQALFLVPSYQIYIFILLVFK